MSRRYCDRYVCEECPLHTKYTEELKKVMSEISIEETKKIIKYAISQDLVTIRGRYISEYNCMMHYYNPNGIYDE